MVSNGEKSSNQRQKIRKRAEGENQQLITGSLRNVTRHSLLVMATSPNPANDHGVPPRLGRGSHGRLRDTPAMHSVFLDGLRHGAARPT